MPRLEWTLCWLSYWAAMAYMSVFGLHDPMRLLTRLLPWAGVYAYTPGGFAEYRETKTGWMTAPGADY